MATTAANLGWQPSGNTQIRATIHYGVDATGVPNAWDFYHLTDNANEKDQDIFLSASIDNQTTADFHNSFRYGLTRKREQYSLWQPDGHLHSEYAYDRWIFRLLRQHGYDHRRQRLLSNGTSAARLYRETYPYVYQLDSNRDQLGLPGRLQVHAASDRTDRLSL